MPKIDPNIQPLSPQDKIFKQNSLKDTQTLSAVKQKIQTATVDEPTQTLLDQVWDDAALPVIGATSSNGPTFQSNNIVASDSKGASTSASSKYSIRCDIKMNIQLNENRKYNRIETGLFYPGTLKFICDNGRVIQFSNTQQFASVVTKVY